MKALPLPCVIAVVGVSFRQDVVRSCKVGDGLAFVADDTNPYDAQAVEVRTGDGKVIGFVPKALAPRLRVSGSTLWTGRITELLTGDVWGVRARIEHATEVVAVDSCQGVAVAAPVCRTDVAVQVRARSGRVLGVLVRCDDSGVVVAGENGTCRYPASLVEVG